VVGVAFKPNVQDERNSPAADVIAGIAARGGDVRFHDPHIASFQDSDGVGRAGVDLAGLIGWADVIVVVTAHRAVDWEALYSTAALVVDTVNSSAGHRVAD